MSLGILLYFFQTQRQVFVSQQKPPEPKGNPHNDNIDRDSFFAVKHAGKHQNPMFGKSKRLISKALFETARFQSSLAECLKDR